MTPWHPPSAVVVDDHPLVARGIADYLRTHCGFARAEGICGADALWAHLEQAGVPTLALVDFWLPDGTALPLLARLRDACPAVRLLVISGDDDPAIRDKVRRLAVDGFLLKHAAPAVFASAVAAVLRGDGWFDDASVPGRWNGDARSLPLSPAELGLTPRQGEVLALMLKGLPNKRVAQQLSLTEQTVKEHVSGILSRLGARTRVELITRLRGKRIDV
ncbi:response regulator transcription factor [Stenotrophomonas acidaminiphila]|uniref:response regulator transcription factor n=1 Tax=Stenotrophomonas acidaminiphila TaxID=128780 RepID=UPI0028B0D218|nr:response regulator transcription factor [Stenotrophomonas acidaminiphila]